MPEQADLREYLQVLTHRKYAIALTTLIVLSAALAYSFLATPVYSAKADVLVPQQQASSALNIQNSQAPSADNLQRTLADEQQFAQGDAVKKAAEQALGYKAKISVASSTTADVLTFAASNTQKTDAANIANAYANAYISQRRANQVAQYTQQVTALQASIAQLQAKASAPGLGPTEKAALADSITTLTQSVQQAQAAADVASQVGPSLVKAATVPTSPSSPKPVRNGALGVVVGLIIGVGIAFLLERLDDGLNSRDAAEEAGGGLPVIGLVPMVASWRTKGSHHLALAEDPDSSVAEAYRTLRTSVQFLGIDEPKHVIAVTSSVPGEGKTTAVANLAVSFARAGMRVFAVSCDLRRPSIHQFFGLDNGIGLTSLAIGQATLADAVKSVPHESRLRVITSGPVPPNPAEILSLDRIREIVDVLVENADLVLLDCPPVLPVTDSLLLSRLADGVLVLASAHTTSRRDLRTTFQMLRQVHAPILGTILNRVPTSGRNSYAYGYGYYGEYAERQPPSPANPVEPTAPISKQVSIGSLPDDDRQSILVNGGQRQRTTPSVAVRSEDGSPPK